MELFFKNPYQIISRSQFYKVFHVFFSKACQLAQGYLILKSLGFAFNIYIYIFVYFFLKIFYFENNLIEYESFLNKSIWPIDGTLTGSTTSDPSGPGSNDIEGLFKTTERSITGV